MSRGWAWGRVVARVAVGEVQLLLMLLLLLLEASHVATQLLQGRDLRQAG